MLRNMSCLALVCISAGLSRERLQTHPTQGIFWIFSSYPQNFLLCISEKIIVNPPLLCTMFLSMILDQCFVERPLGRLLGSSRLTDLVSFIGSFIIFPGALASFTPLASIPVVTPPSTSGSVVPKIRIFVGSGRVSVTSELVCQASLTTVLWLLAVFLSLILQPMSTVAPEPIRIHYEFQKKS